MTSTSVVCDVAFSLEQQLTDARAGDGVEIAGGLVREQHRRPRDEGAGDCHALLLTAGELARIVAGAIAEADAVQCLPARCDARFGRPASSSGSITFSSAVSAGTR